MFDMMHFAAAFASACLLTLAAHRYAVSRQVIDVPSERSSHATPTPRGGGVAIVLTVLGYTTLQLVLGGWEDKLLIAMLGGGMLVAAIGWLDDHRPIPARVRAAVHLIAAGWAIYWLGGLSAVRVGTTTMQPGLLGTCFAVIFIVWFINLYNFMDGIDGIAGAEAASVAGFAFALAAPLTTVGSHPTALIIAGAAAGFLVWNWTPARIFMGDVGSGFLGFCFAVLAIHSETSQALPLLVWLILLAIFWVDATLTLLRRAWRGEVWYAAHRSHAYQRAVQAGYSHAQVTTAVIALNILLAALAWLATRDAALMLPALALAMLVVLAVYVAVEKKKPMSRSES